MYYTVDYDLTIPDSRYQPLMFDVNWFNLVLYNTNLFCQLEM